MEEERLDNENLLPSSSSASLSLRLTSAARDNRDLRIATRTLILSTLVYSAVGIWIVISVKDGSFVSDIDDFCLNHISRYSPIVKDVKPNWNTVQYNGSFLHETIYRQSAGLEVDAAWEALGVNYRSVVIPLSEAEKSGLRSEQVQISEYYGGGFLANVEGLHHLHCLNLLRQALKWNYDYYLKKNEGASSNSEDIVRYHTTHCLDILRQQLMCVTDVGVLGQVWWRPDGDSHPEPFVDFNTKHRCRDFEAIRKWAEGHQLPPATEMDMSRLYKLPDSGYSILPEIP